MVMTLKRLVLVGCLVGCGVLAVPFEARAQGNWHDPNNPGNKPETCWDDPFDIYYCEDTESLGLYWHEHTPYWTDGYPGVYSQFGEDVAVCFVEGTCGDWRP